MKAPEKIYLTEDNPSKEWYRTKQVGFDSIEYIRKDAFIEKALEWIGKEIRPYYSEVKYKYEDFKNHIK